MKITVLTALAAATLAFAPLAHAGEGNGDPFAFSIGPIGGARFTDGVVVAIDDELGTASYAARDVAPLQPATEVAELPAEDGLAAGYVPGR